MNYKAFTLTLLVLVFGSLVFGRDSVANESELIKLISCNLNIKTVLFLVDDRIKGNV